MAENTIGLKSVSEILGMNFFIPSYQRGYRWDKQQVEDLLDDIYTFATKKKETEKEFYCLQPIVVKKLKDEEKAINNLDNSKEWYEVIDGQQRLTTIRIILSYLESEFGGKMIDGHFIATSLKDKFGKPNFDLEYQTQRVFLIIFQLQMQIQWIVFLSSNRILL
jgi:CRISPR/Cas system endoribonuclease Cas6 (RAMP superfamily)